MVPIILNSQGDSLSFENFEAKFIEICEEHKSSNRALAFAFILYDFQQPHIFKVLDDIHYWRALHNLSGHLLTIFSIQHKEQHKDVHQNEDETESFSFEYMTGVNYYSNPSIASTNLINKYFDRQIEITYPSILFFQVDHTEIIDSLVVKLKEQEVEKSYLEIKTLIQASVEALGQIDPEYSLNSQGIFDMVQLNIKALSAGESFYRLYKYSKSIYTFVKALKGFIA